MPRSDSLSARELMLLDLAESDRRASIQGKVTAIIATSVAPLPMLAWSLCSLLLRSRRGGILERVIVVISGSADDTELQDRKQAFVNDLRRAGFPLWVVRIYGPVGYGHSESLDSAVSWVYTQAYLLMHDDAILLSRDWESKAQAVLDSPNVVMATTPGVFPTGYGHNEASDSTGGTRPAVLVNGLNIYERRDRPDELYVGFPHINTVFTLCRKDLLASIPGRWTGYNVLASDDESFAGEERLKRLTDIHNAHTFVECETIRCGKTTWLGMDIGSWLYAECIRAGLEFSEFPSETVKHFVAMSWRDDDGKRETTAQAWQSQEVSALEAEIDRSDAFREVYGRHVQGWAATM